MGKRVIILGAGNVAFDCARTAVRLGAEDVSLAFRKKRKQLTADLEEIEQAEQEGVRMLEGRTFDRVVGTDHVEGMEFSIIKKNYKDPDVLQDTVDEYNEFCRCGVDQGSALPA